MASPQRISRVRGQLLRELSDIIMRMKDPRLQLVHIVDVELSRDMSYAKIFISALGDEQDEALEGMRKGLGFIRREIAQKPSKCAPKNKTTHKDNEPSQSHEQHAECLALHGLSLAHQSLERKPLNATDDDRMPLIVHSTRRVAVAEVSAV